MSTENTDKYSNFSPVERLKIGEDATMRALQKYALELEKRLKELKNNSDPLPDGFKKYMDFSEKLKQEDKAASEAYPNQLKTLLNDPALKKFTDPYWESVDRLNSLKDDQRTEIEATLKESSKLFWSMAEKFDQKARELNVEEKDLDALRRVFIEEQRESRNRQRENQRNSLPHVLQNLNAALPRAKSDQITKT